jgi:hypothetical protein
MTLNDPTEYEKEIEKNRGKKNTEKPVLHSSFYEFEIDSIKYMAEQIFDPIKESIGFAVYNCSTKQVNYWNKIDLDNIIVKPILDEEVRRQHILLPSKIEEFGNDQDLDEELRLFISKWLDINEDFILFGIWNIKRSWVFQRFHTLNYLRALGDTGQGKSRFLDTLGSLHYKAIATSGATTTAPIFRIIDKWKGTIIMDEADFRLSDESQDIIKIINQGYERGKPVMRCDQNDAEKVKFFDVFCPKLLATRRTFTDKATESRCITAIMKGTQRTDIPFNINKEFHNESLKLRNKLLLWRFRNYYEIKPDQIVKFDMDNLEPRVKQIVASFINLFSHDSKQMEKFNSFITSYQTQLITERQDSFDGQIVGAIYELLKENKKFISASDIIDKGQLTDRQGKELKPRGLSSPLKSLGLLIDSKPKRIDTKLKKCLILEKEQLTNLFKRYGYCVTDVTLHTDSLETVTFGNSNEFGAPSNKGNNSNKVTVYSCLKEQKDEISCEDFKKQRCPALEDSEYELIIDDAKKDGLIFEPKPGFIKSI